MKHFMLTELSRKPMGGMHLLDTWICSTRGFARHMDLLDRLLLDTCTCSTVFLLDTWICSTRTFARHIHLLDTWICSTWTFARQWFCSTILLLDTWICSTRLLFIKGVFWDEESESEVNFKKSIDAKNILLYFLMMK